MKGCSENVTNIGKWRCKKITALLVVSAIWMALHLVMASRCLALEGSLRASLGYDDNATLEAEGLGSGFMLGRVELFQQLSRNPDIFSMEVYLNGFYQDYFGHEDRFLSTGGISMGKEALDGLLLGGLFMEGSVFRDDLVPEDQYNGFSMGGYVNYLLTTQMEITLRQVFSWRDFRRRVAIFLPVPPMPPPGGSGVGNGANSGMGMQPGPGPVQPPGPPAPRIKWIEREDTDSLTELSTSLYLSPNFTATVGGSHENNRSNVDPESFEANGGYLFFKWVPDDRWALSLSLSVSKARYDKDRAGREREDQIRSASLEISRFLGGLQWFFQLGLSDIDSSLKSETYQQTVTQCGAIWQF